MSCTRRIAKICTGKAITYPNAHLVSISEKLSDYCLLLQLWYLSNLE